MTRDEEARFEEKAENMLAGHRGLIDGRDYRWNCFRFRDSELGANKSFAEKYDETFPEAPGSSIWFNTQFCLLCEKRVSMCECPKYLPTQNFIVDPAEGMMLG